MHAGGMIAIIRNNQSIAVSNELPSIASFNFNLLHIPTAREIKLYIGDNLKENLLANTTIVFCVATNFEHYFCMI